MKSWFLGFALVFNLIAAAQSPFLHINVIMDSAKAGQVDYKIEMKICKPKKTTERGSWFSHDTSTIDFASLRPQDIDDGHYFDKGTPDRISGPPERPVYNGFEFSNNVFAWEQLYVFKITNHSSRAWWPPMYIVIPIKYKSFITFIDLTGIVFQTDQVLFIDHPDAFYKDSDLHIRQSLENQKAVDVKDFFLKKILLSR